MTDQHEPSDSTPAEEPALAAPGDQPAADAPSDAGGNAPVDGSPADGAADGRQTPAAEPELADGEPETPPGGPDTVATGWRRLAGSIFTRRLTAANTIIALLIGLLGFALIAQVHSNANESTLANDRPDDLVRILSDLDARRDRLSTEISTLQDTVRQLNSGAQSRQAALAAAAKRGDELGILGGTLPATGSGLLVDLVPPAGKQIAANDVVNTVEELRGAGAEAMQINGTDSSAVRIIASTWFVDVSGGVDVDDRVVGGTLTIAVIGDPQTMQAALSIAGGVVDSIHSDGGDVRFTTPAAVRVSALQVRQPLQYAKPVS